MQFMHPLPLVGLKPGLDLRHVNTRRIVADADILGPLEQREVRHLVYDLEDGLALSLLPCAREQVVLQVLRQKHVPVVVATYSGPTAGNLDASADPLAGAVEPCECGFF